MQIIISDVALHGMKRKNKKNCLGAGQSNLNSKVTELPGLASYSFSLWEIIIILLQDGRIIWVTVNGGFTVNALHISYNMSNYRYNKYLQM